jgi:hypothetical protein
VDCAHNAVGVRRDFPTVLSSVHDSIRAGLSRRAGAVGQFEKRRNLMEAWAAFCEPKATGKVVPIKIAR